MIVKRSIHLLYELCNGSGTSSFGHRDPNVTSLGPLRQSPFGTSLIFGQKKFRAQLRVENLISLLLPYKKREIKTWFKKRPMANPFTWHVILMKIICSWIRCLKIRVVFLMSMRRQLQWSTIIITLTFLFYYSLCDDSWLRFSSHSYFITALFYAEVLPETSSGQDNRNLNSANEDNQNLGKDEIEALRKDGLSGEVC